MRDVSLLIMFIGLILTMSCQDEISAQHIDSLFGDEYKELIMENDKACALTQRLVDYMGNTYPLYYGGSYIDKNQRLVVLVVDSLLHEQSKLLNVLKKDEFVAKEYQKEFYGEGQAFFYNKRKNVIDILWTDEKGSTEIYVLPLPKTELKYES